MSADRDRIYEPEEFGQLAKDLVAARGTPLDSLEKASLKRWQGIGQSARIRRLHDHRLTCWPVDLPTSPAPSAINGQRTTPRDAMAFLRGERDYRVNVGIRFDPGDVDKLRAATIAEPGETLFSEALASAERDSQLVVRVMGPPELQNIIARFAKAGIAHLTVDTLRVGASRPVRV